MDRLVEDTYKINLTFIKLQTEVDVLNKVVQCALDLPKTVEVLDILEYLKEELSLTQIKLRKLRNKIQQGDA